jgi:lantibiotic modifying enzyme
MEFVAAQACKSEEEVRRFYERQGAYLALLYALEATDFHSENLIAAGEHPVLLDLEALFHPRVGGIDLTQAEQLAGNTMNYSVLRVGLLPNRIWSNDESVGIDLSGLGSLPGQLSPRPFPRWEGSGTDEMRLTRKRVEMPGGHNRPTLNGAEVNVLDYTDAILTGFNSVYGSLLKYRDVCFPTKGPRSLR